MFKLLISGRILLTIIRYFLFKKLINVSEFNFIIINFKIFFIKLQLAASKKSGGPPVIIQHKDEIEAILNKDRPILSPKSCIDSSTSLPRKEVSDNSQEISEINDKKGTSYELPKICRKHTTKHENEEDNQDKKKLKSNKPNLENTIQRVLEQQEARYIESTKRREEQRSELFQMKQQNDFMLFSLLNNLTNCLGSLSRGSGGSQNNQSIYSVMNEGM